MSTETNPDPITYQVIPSKRVSAAARALIQRAIAVGRGQEVLAALKELNRILTIYPQYGEPIRDLRAAGQAADKPAPASAHDGHVEELLLHRQVALDIDDEERAAKEIRQQQAEQAVPLAQYFALDGHRIAVVSPPQI